MCNRTFDTLEYYFLVPIPFLLHGTTIAGRVADLFRRKVCSSETFVFLYTGTGRYSDRK